MIGSMDDSAGLASAHNRQSTPPKPVMKVGVTLGKKAPMTKIGIPKGPKKGVAMPAKKFPPGTGPIPKKMPTGPMMGKLPVKVAPKVPKARPAMYNSHPVEVPAESEGLSEVGAVEEVAVPQAESSDADMKDVTTEGKSSTTPSSTPPNEEADIKPVDSSLFDFEPDRATTGNYSNMSVEPLGSPDDTVMMSVMRSSPMFAQIKMPIVGSTDTEHEIKAGISPRDTDQLRSDGSSTVRASVTSESFDEISRSEQQPPQVGLTNITSKISGVDLRINTSLIPAGGGFGTVSYPSVESASEITGSRDESGSAFPESVRTEGTTFSSSSQEDSQNTSSSGSTSRSGTSSPDEWASKDHMATDKHTETSGSESTETIGHKISLMDEVASPMVFKPVVGQDIDTLFEISDVSSLNPTESRKVVSGERDTETLPEVPFSGESRVPITAPSVVEAVIDQPFTSSIEMSTELESQTDTEQPPVDLGLRPDLSVLKQESEKDEHLDTVLSNEERSRGSSGTVENIVIDDTVELMVDQTLPTMDKAPSFQDASPANESRVSAADLKESTVVEDRSDNRSESEHKSEDEQQRDSEHKSEAEHLVDSEHKSEAEHPLDSEHKSEAEFHLDSEHKSEAELQIGSEHKSEAEQLVDSEHKSEAGHQVDSKSDAEQKSDFEQQSGHESVTLETKQGGVEDEESSREGPLSRVGSEGKSSSGQITKGDEALSVDVTTIDREEQASIENLLKEHLPSITAGVICEICDVESEKSSIPSLSSQKLRVDIISSSSPDDVVGLVTSATGSWEIPLAPSDRLPSVTITETLASEGLSISDVTAQNESADIGLVLNQTSEEAPKRQGQSVSELVCTVVESPVVAQEIPLSARPELLEKPEVSSGSVSSSVSDSMDMETMDVAQVLEGVIASGQPIVSQEGGWSSQDQAPSTDISISRDEIASIIETCNRANRNFNFDTVGLPEIRQAVSGLQELLDRMTNPGSFPKGKDTTQSTPIESARENFEKSDVSGSEGTPSSTEPAVYQTEPADTLHVNQDAPQSYGNSYLSNEMSRNGTNDMGSEESEFEGESAKLSEEQDAPDSKQEVHSEQEAKEPGPIVPVLPGVCVAVVVGMDGVLDQSAGSTIRRQVELMSAKEDLEWTATEEVSVASVLVCLDDTTKISHTQQTGMKPEKEISQGASLRSPYTGMLVPFQLPRTPVPNNTPAYSPAAPSPVASPSPSPSPYAGSCDIKMWPNNRESASSRESISYKPSETLLDTASTAFPENSIMAGSILSSSRVDGMYLSSRTIAEGTRERSDAYSSVAGSKAAGEKGSFSGFMPSRNQASIVSDSFLAQGGFSQRVSREASISRNIQSLEQPSTSGSGSYVNTSRLHNEGTFTLQSTGNIQAPMNNNSPVVSLSDSRRFTTSQNYSGRSAPVAPVNDVVYTQPTSFVMDAQHSSKPVSGEQRFGAVIGGPPVSMPLHRLSIPSPLMPQRVPQAPFSTSVLPPPAVSSQAQFIEGRLVSSQISTPRMIGQVPRADFVSHFALPPSAPQPSVSSYRESTVTALEVPLSHRYSYSGDLHRSVPRISKSFETEGAMWQRHPEMPPLNYTDLNIVRSGIQNQIQMRAPSSVPLNYRPDIPQENSVRGMLGNTLAAHMPKQDILPSVGGFSSLCAKPPSMTEGHYAVTLDRDSCKVASLPARQWFASIPPRTGSTVTPSIAQSSAAEHVIFPKGSAAQVGQTSQELQDLESADYTLSKSRRSQTFARSTAVNSLFGARKEKLRRCCHC